ncbi:MAG: hypothetical protein COB67_00070 [SAR324 cluster bacterium]|uniref:Uncharacterized protein n=1 Tax=SAR324 cluster bacterium TaxID=2024889 RepID=A0A2A4TBY4_9DELT|nr:MAG: hypothetical protein COB67_00070 [SAR324 cluster bacterium]
MYEFTVKTIGKGKILSSECIPSPNDDKQNWWLVTLKNGPTEFVLHIPKERQREVTNQCKKEFLPGNVISFISTPSKGKEIALEITHCDSHRQGLLTF